MSTGTIKWFNPKKGYGFILLEDNKKQIFFHYNGLVMEGYRKINSGQRVEFESIKYGKYTQAINVRKI